MFKGNVQQKPSSNLLPMLMLGTLFFIFGLVSWVNSILIPYFKVASQDCGLWQPGPSYSFRQPAPGPIPFS